MVAELLNMITGSGFENAETSIEKIKKTTLSLINKNIISHNIVKERSFCRLFRGGCSETGFSISGSEENSFRKALVNISGLNPMYKEKRDMSDLLPEKATQVNMDMYDIAYPEIGKKEFEDIRVMIDESCLNFPGLELNFLRFSKSEKKYYLANTKGLNVKYRKTGFLVELKFILNENSVMVNRYSSHFNALNPLRLVPRAFTLLNSLTDNELQKKKRYTFVFSQEASSSILRIFSPFFLPSGNGDVKKVNFPRVLNIIDNKTIEDQPGSVPFDDEGIQGGETVLVGKGVFNTPITNIKSAVHRNALSTGNGFRRGESPFTSVNFSNLYIKPTVLPVANLLKSSSESVLISLVRLKYREGKNYIFSAYGYMFRNGKREEPVHFHFSTTFLSFFLNIIKISSELKFFHSDINVGSSYLLLEGKNCPGDRIVEI